MNAIQQPQFKAEYIHCPQCGGLDRHFFRGFLPTMWKKGFCYTCKAYFLRSAFTEASASRRWMVLVKREEISIVRECFHHGRISFGWFGPDKILIASLDNTNALGPDSKAREAVIRLAEEEAAAMNQKENI